MGWDTHSLLKFNWIESLSAARSARARARARLGPLNPERENAVAKAATGGGNKQELAA